MKTAQVLEHATALYMIDPTMFLNFNDGDKKMHHKPNSIIAAKKKAAKDARKRTEKKRLKGKK